MGYQSIMKSNHVDSAKTPKDILKRALDLNDRRTDLLQPNLTWEQKVLRVLHAIRCREFTEYNPKLNHHMATRFNMHNIAFFDLDKESELKHRTLFCKIPRQKYDVLDGSMNVISIKVIESDVSFPINIYGTVLARDIYDYRCVYLFKRDRNNPQHMSSLDDTLTLTGPNRAIAGSYSVFFEFHLKIKGEGAGDQDFCKGFLERVTCSDCDYPRSLSLVSGLSTVEMVYTPIWTSLEASLGVSILNGKSSFAGNITACTTDYPGCGIVLYDSEVAGTETKLENSGSVKLTRRIVSVSHKEKLTLKFSLEEGGNRSRTTLLLVKNDVEQHSFTLGPYVMQVKITWTGILEYPEPWDQVGFMNVLR